MTNDAILPPRTFQEGFWGAMRRNGHDVQAVWEDASRAVAATFGLSPDESRDLLDGPAGKVLADDLAFIEGGSTGCHAIEALLRARLEQCGWSRWYAHAIAGARAER